MQLGNLIGDALEGGFPISHAVQDAAEGPHITFGADLKGEKQKMFFTTVLQSEMIA